MYSTKTKNLPTELLNFDDEDDEKRMMIEFYESNLHLMTYPVGDISYEIIRKVAIMLDSKSYFRDYDWRDYATKMGIINAYKLDEIEVSAKSHNDQPIFFAMYIELKSECFGKIIKALLSSERYDVLSEIESYVRGLIESHSKTKVKRIVSVEKELFDSPNNLSELCTVKFNSALLNEHKKNEFDSFQQYSIDKCSKNPYKIHNTLGSSEPSSNYPSENVKDVIASAPTEERLSVLVQHTEFDIDNARRLSAMLRDEGMAVLSLSDLDTMSSMNAECALRTVFQEMDFIVPIVSESFLQQIYPQDFDQYLESTYAKNNSTLYGMIMTEYRNNRCLNFRVRPVIVPEMNRRRLVREVIFSLGYKLWNGVPNLIKNLRETKRIEPQQLIQ